MPIEKVSFVEVLGSEEAWVSDKILGKLTLDPLVVCLLILHQLQERK